MTQAERQLYLIDALLCEEPRYKNMVIPQNMEEQKKLLRSLMNVRLAKNIGSYRSCLELAEQNKVESIAFCCISTGEFHFPNDKAAEIAVQTVKDYKEQTGSDMGVIFNVFKDIDYEIYRGLLDTD